MKLILVSVLLFISASLPGASDCDNLKISLSITHTTGGQDNGKVDVVVDQGKGPFKVFLFADKKKNNKLDVKIKDLVNLSSGEYLLVIQDNIGCSFQKTIVIN